MPNLFLITAGLVETLSILAISTAVIDLQYWVRYQKGILSKRLILLANEMKGLGLLRQNAKKSKISDDLVLLISFHSTRHL
jgi:hypothetical protein